MAVTQYIGARYVPVFADPIQWDDQRTYEPLTIVQFQGASYTSKQAVPIGANINDEKYWALTGNYNAQIEQYRQEVAQYDGRINAVESDIANVQDSLGEAAYRDVANALGDNDNKLVTALTVNSQLGQLAGKEIESEPTEDSQNLINSGAVYAAVQELNSKIETDESIQTVLNFETIVSDASDQVYNASNPPSPNWDTIQGLTATREGRFMGSFSPGLYYVRITPTQYTNAIVLREFNEDGTVYRESQPLQCGHGNSLAYIPRRNLILCIENYTLTGANPEQRIGSNKCYVISYNNFEILQTITIDAATELNAVSYDTESDTLLISDTSSFRSWYLDPDTFEITQTISLEAFRYIYRKTRPAYNASHRQSVCHNSKYIVMNTYMPNMFVFIERENPSKLVAYVTDVDTHSVENEDFHIDNEGNIILAKHLRYYNRVNNNLTEAVSNMYFISKSNYYKNWFELYWSFNSTRLASGSILVDPSTNAVLQNGSEQYPCKTFMQAYYYATLSGGTQQMQIVFPSNARGNVKICRVGNCNNLTIINQAGNNVKFSNNTRVTNSSLIIFENINWEDLSSSPDCITFPYSSNQPAPSASLSNLRLYQCNNTQDTTFTVSNCFFINSKPNVFLIDTINRNMWPEGYQKV